MRIPAASLWSVRIRLACPHALAPGFALRSMAAGFAVFNPARPAIPAPEAAPPPQTQARPRPAYRRLTPRVVLVLVVMFVVFVVVLAMTNATYARVLSLLEVL